MKNLTIALLSIAAANAVKLEQTDYDYSTFSVANIQTTYTFTTATVSFDAPSTALSSIDHYVVNFKGPSVDKELECTESPCVFETSSIGELQPGTQIDVLVKPHWNKDFVVPFPLAPAATEYMAKCDSSKNQALADVFNYYDQSTQLLQEADCLYDFDRATYYSRYDSTPLMYAVTYDETEFIRAMIKHGVDVNERAPVLDGSGSESAPIIQAGEYEVVKALLDAGANPQVASEQLYTPIDWQIYRAEWYGIDLRSLEALIDKGAACDDNHSFTIQRTTWLSTLVDALPNSAEVRQLFSSKGCPGFV